MDNKNFLYLRITADSRCNLRCIYCNPYGEFNSSDNISDKDLRDIIEIAYENGIQTIHWTGGEPLLRESLVDLVKEAALIGIKTQSITTNGILLCKYANALYKAGLTGTSISLDTLKPDKFKRITGVNAFLNVYSSIVESCSLFKNVVANMVVMPSNFDEIHDFIKFAVEMEGRFIPRFCELQPYGPAFEDHISFDDYFIPREQIMKKIEELGNTEEVFKKNIDNENIHSSYFIIRDLGIRIGIIAPYSNGWPCGGVKCGRIRIGGSGTTKACVRSKNKYEFKGLSFSEKRNLFNEVLQEKSSYAKLNKFPQYHIPAYKQLRFGL